MNASSPSPRPILVGLPYDGSSSFLTGARLAPAAIRQALRSPAGNLWSEALIDLGAPAALEDAGDVELAQDASARPAIEAAIGRLAAAGGAPIALGGDHSVSFPILAGLRPPGRGCTSSTLTRIPICMTSSRATASRTPAPSPGFWRAGWPIR